MHATGLLVNISLLLFFLFFFSWTCTASRMPPLVKAGKEELEQMARRRKYKNARLETLPFPSMRKPLKYDDPAQLNRVICADCMAHLLELDFKFHKAPDVGPIQGLFTDHDRRTFEEFKVPMWLWRKYNADGSFWGYEHTDAAFLATDCSKLLAARNPPNVCQSWFFDFSLSHIYDPDRLIDAEDVGATPPQDPTVTTEHDTTKKAQDEETGDGQKFQFVTHEPPKRSGTWFGNAGTVVNRALNRAFDNKPSTGVPPVARAQMPKLGVLAP